MRSTLVILLLIAGGYVAQAQSKRNIYCDVAINSPGLSATYTMKLTRHFDMGGGLSSYYFRQVNYGSSRSAISFDLRPHWGAKKSLFFIFTDLGLAINGGRQPYLATMSPLGGHIALGPGYCFRINKKGMGPYLSLGMYGNTTHLRDTYPPPPPRSRMRAYLDVYGIMSVGFKF